MELLIGIKEDVASIRTHLEDMDDNMTDIRVELKSHQDRLRRIELIVLPVTAFLAYLGSIVFA